MKSVLVDIGSCLTTLIIIIYRYENSSSSKDNGAVSEIVNSMEHLPLPISLNVFFFDSYCCI